jgi:hypothetical protein
VEVNELEEWKFDGVVIQHGPCSDWAEWFSGELRCWECGKHTPQAWKDVALLSGTWDVMQWSFTWEVYDKERSKSRKKGRIDE